MINLQTFFTRQPYKTTYIYIHLCICVYLFADVVGVLWAELRKGIRVYLCVYMCLVFCLPLHRISSLKCGILISSSLQTNECVVVVYHGEASTREEVTLLTALGHTNTKQAKLVALEQSNFNHTKTSKSSCFRDFRAALGLPSSRYSPCSVYVKVSRWGKLCKQKRSRHI